MPRPATTITAAIVAWLLIWIIVCSVQFARTSALVRDGVFPAFTLSYFWQIFLPFTLAVALLAGLACGVIIALLVGRRANRQVG